MFPPMHMDEERDEDGEVTQAGRRLLPQADELPDAQPDLPGARPQLPRAAAAPGRVRHGLPLRDVRRGARSDPGARDDPGRRAHLLHPGADAGRAAALLEFVLDCCGTTGWTTSTWSCPRGPTEKLVGDDAHWEERPARCGGGRASGLELVPDPGGAAFYGPKISSRPRTRSAAPGRCPPSSWTSTCPSGSSSSSPAADGTRQRPGHDPPRPVRLDRALLRRADRALRRGVPGLAGAGAGGRHPGRRGVQRLPGRGRRAAAAAGVRAEVDTTDDRMQKKIRTAQQAEGAVHADRRRQDAEAGAVSFRFRDGSRTTASPSTRPSAGSSTRSATRTSWRRRHGVKDARGRAGDPGDDDADDATWPGSRTRSSGCGPRTGWPTSRADKPLGTPDACPFCARPARRTRTR